MPSRFRSFLKNIYINLFRVPVVAGLGRVTIAGLFFFIVGLFGAAEFWLGGNDRATAVLPMALGAVGLAILIVDWLIRHIGPKPAMDWASAANADPALARRAKICGFAGLFAVWAGAGLMGYLLFGVLAYFFAVPQACNCIADTIPGTLADALILKNSIRDASLINVEVRDGDVRVVRACYQQKPASGNTVTQKTPGPFEKQCRYENRFSLHMLGSAKTYDEAIVAISVQDDSLLPKNGSKSAIKSYQEQKTTGQFYMNRKDMACSLRLADWVDVLPARLRCGQPKFHFNPWDWSQLSELFYTRVFFTMHPQRR